MVDYLRNNSAPMYQTMVPFVEIFIKGKDILRSTDGKPRTLLSFSFTELIGYSGSFSFEVFDPEYVAIEELILTTGVSGIDVSEDAYNANASNPTPGSRLSPILFRFGYISNDGKVLSSSGESYYAGSVETYTPTMATNGVQLTITGHVYGTLPMRHLKKRPIPATYNMSLYETVRKVCTLMNWEFVSLNDGGKELPADQQPEPLFDVGQSLDSTEEQHKSFKMKDSETALQFLNRIIMDARPNDPKYGLYEIYLNYSVDEKPEEGSTPVSTGYLHFGPQDFKQAPVRRYISMRDPTSDVITFAPTVLGTVASMVGASGSVVKGEDPATGDTSVKVKNAPNSYASYFSNRRRHTFIYRPQDSFYAQGFIENPASEEKLEGTNTGPQTLAPANAHHLDDEVITEISVRETGKMNADRQSLNHYLSAQMFANEATLEIFGDPSDDLQVSRLVVVFVLVPIGDGQRFRMHYTSNIYQIHGITHQISGGTYTTTLQLLKNSIGGEGGVSSKALYAELDDLLGVENGSAVS